MLGSGQPEVRLRDNRPTEGRSSVRLSSPGDHSALWAGRGACESISEAETSVGMNALILHTFLLATGKGLSNGDMHWLVCRQV